MKRIHMTLSTTTKQLGLSRNINIQIFFHPYESI